MSLANPASLSAPLLAALQDLQAGLLPPLVLLPLLSVAVFAAPALLPGLLPGLLLRRSLARLAGVAVIAGMLYLAAPLLLDRLPVLADAIVASVVY